MSDNRKYYYLKLKENYFDDDSIYKPKPKEETAQSENLETDQSLATVNEDNQSGNENGT
ncbi:MAG TPA: hypothetical protein OIM02_06665 [Faecalibacterium prausnitzii]|nr:hypothetical protein [Faecalibacterium prausnitzii]